MWIYFVPFAEYMFSFNITAIQGLFSHLLENLDFVTVTKALRSPKDNETRSVFCNRWAWYCYYFVVMATMFIISFVSSDADFASYVSSAFGLVCIIIPIIALFRPVVVAWHVLLVDRDDIEFMPQVDIVDIPMDSSMPEPDAPDPDPSARVSGPKRTWENLAGHYTVLLVDPSNLLDDHTWVDFLRSAATAHARPQCGNPHTWIATSVALIWLVAVIALDIYRLVHVRDEREQMKESMQNIFKAISEEYQLGLPAPEIPSEMGEIVYLTIRMLVFIFLFPVTVLSHHATLLLPHRWRYLEEKYSAVRLAKIVGLLLVVAGIVLMIAGAALREVEPWFLPDEIFSSPLTNGSRSMSTLADLDPLCSRTVADWTLLQLAGAPVLIEARLTNQTFYRDFAAHLDIPLLEDDDDFRFNTSSLIAFSRADRRLLVSPASIPFVDSYGIYLENQLATYYSGIIDECVPLYGLASKFFLSNLLPGPSQALSTGILGPNRLGVQWFSNATLSVKQELEIISEIMGAIGLTAERPVLVGHGATGLIAKALQFEDRTEPWRVAFESSVLHDSPMATISGAGENDRTVRTIINFIGDGSLYAQPDQAALGNFQLLVYPKASKLIPGLKELVPPHSLRTFCLIQAACGSDSMLDDMCARAFPEEFEEGMCRMYARPRTHEAPDSN
jgi:uncharacterized membrane protein HdeD (DUF308 family)